MRALKDLMVKNGSAPVQQKRELDDKTVFFAFEKVVASWYGFKGRENIFPEDWKDGTLSIRVRSSLWLNEVAFGDKESFEMKDDLLESEWEKFMEVNPVDQDHYAPVKMFFKAYVTDEKVREIIASRQTGRF
jgi:hypothetical protein